MSEHRGPRTVGVEEELLLVDPLTGVPRAVAASMLRRAAADPVTDASPSDGDIEAELQQQQIEVETSPCTRMDDLERQIRDWRRYADDLARRSDARIAALATSPLPVAPQTMVKPRYRRMVERFGLTTMEQLTCGCHVHVGVRDDDEGVAVIDGLQRWLPAVLALSSNSPFWQGRDSGYASYRSQVWSRLPCTGATAAFGDAESYRDQVERLVASGVLLDADMVYFNARLSRHYPTVEIRIADVCLRAEDTIMIAALARALVDVEAAIGRSTVPVDRELVRLAHWQASRDGLRGRLLCPVESRPLPAADVITALVDHVDDALERNGDRERVRAGIARVLGRGTGADLQRELLQRGGAEQAMRSMIDMTLD
ncbi:carboxylate-amine ligase [Microlunatus soli]|uniref:Putative glutamate--cysteine ligase 2 n=1 Tax=Microlunatus soli TaxID=630515 RepID=A0A1H1N4A3_9ACTN|nr:glutamate--cysteine ligase [Microlunatus soli]SDR93806.1 carboxylate-amine ligase [Microlunatus soli]